MSKHKRGHSLNKRGLTIDVRQGRDEVENKANLEKALRQFKRRVTQEGLVSDIRKNEFHQTKGQTARRKKEEAVRRNNKLKAKRSKDL